MTLTETQRNQIIMLAKDGASVTEIASALKVSRPTVYKVIDLAMAEIKQKVEEKITQTQTEVAKATEGKEELPEPEIIEAEHTGKPKEKQPVDIQTRILDKAKSTFSRKAGDSLGQDLTEDLERYLASARIVKRYELIQRAEIEELGIKWEDYLAWIFEKGYEAIQQEIYEQLKEESRKASAVSPEELVELNVQRKMMWG